MIMIRMPSKYDKAIDAGFAEPKPDRFKYGLSWDYHEKEFNDTLAKRTRFGVALCVGLTLLAGILGLVISQRWFFAGDVGNNIGKMFLIGCALAGATWFGSRWYIENHFLPPERHKVRDFQAAVRAWEKRCEAWIERNAETGLTYWREMRGIQFEEALAKLFRTRHCEVKTTKVSGDGGVDLIIKIGGLVLWAQCKGYAKPITVGPIREIAGVCSRSPAIPIVFAVNGYTKPAIQTAEQFGVLIYSAEQTARLAEFEDLNLFAPYIEPDYARNLRRAIISTR